ncbi:MAG: hypothetical protein H7Z75_07445 [Ferruginibacter sp.]|nr:hypothetical protein [Cytophagales bacterium]
MKKNNLDSIYNRLLSDKTKKSSERAILIIAIISFLIHLILIFLIDFDLIAFESSSKLLKNPIAAIYTPFSFILVYEVYLLIYYLPKSITTYIRKQYEIITLIIIRRLFKDLSSLELSSNWFQIKDDLQFTYDLIASVLLFYLLYLFYSKSQKSYNYREKIEDSTLPTTTTRFIDLKKIIAICLVPLLLILATYTFISWTIDTFYSSDQLTDSFKNINNIFFDEFFTILIIVDVILLLLSFFRTDEFHKVIRNSGFIISTILIRLSFSVEGLVNTVLIVSAITFGLLMLTIHDKYEKITRPNNG